MVTVGRFTRPLSTAYRTGWVSRGPSFRGWVERLLVAGADRIRKFDELQGIHLLGIGDES